MLNRMFRIVAMALVLAIAVPAAAFADDWVAVKLRGVVMQLVDGDWSPLERGDIVPDDRVIRTLASGRVDFQRDAETISLGASSQIQIRDKAGQRYTTVKQYFGTVEIEAEVQNVKHFEVDTPFLAAVVKGTRFIVKTTPKGSTVEVKRGIVEVTSAKTGTHAMIPAGQTASVGAAGDFDVTGRGADKTQVVGAAGVVVSGPGAVVSVAGVEVGANVGADGVVVGVTTPVGVDADVVVTPDNVVVDADVGDVATVDVTGNNDGVTAGVTVGGTSVGVSVGGGGGGGISVSVGGLGGGLL